MLLSKSACKRSMSSWVSFIPSSIYGKASELFTVKALPSPGADRSGEAGVGQDRDRRRHVRCSEKTDSRSSQSAASRQAAVLSEGLKQPEKRRPADGKRHRRSPARDRGLAC